jgi:hypothetical protein
MDFHKILYFSGLAVLAPWRECLGLAVEGNLTFADGFTGHRPISRSMG